MQMIPRPTQRRWCARVVAAGEAGTAAAAPGEFVLAAVATVLEPELEVQRVWVRLTAPGEQRQLRQRAGG